MTSSSKTYPIARKKSALLLSWACLLFSLIPFIGVGLDLSSGKRIGFDYIITIAFWILIWAIFSFVFRRWAMTAKLTISPNGVECDDIASLVGFSTNWENIRSVEASKMRLFLLLEKPSTPITKLGKWASKSSLVRPDIIDLSSFIEHWKNGELKSDFAKYVPHLLQSESR